MMNVQLGTSLTLTSFDQTTVSGCVVDIDTFQEAEELPFFEDMDGVLSNAHQAAKEVFFGVLGDELLKGYECEYDD